ncbi:MAG: hypothetical protein V3U58_06205 [Thermodesulfobacteriota bacterium]
MLEQSSWEVSFVRAARSIGNKINSLKLANKADVVVTIAKKEQEQFETAAASFVITSTTTLRAAFGSKA